MSASSMIANGSIDGAFKKSYDSHRRKFQQKYAATLQKTSFAGAPAGLKKAVLYSLNAGGKRLRPVLCLESSKLAGLGPAAAMACATAFECLHTYSLVHDDLPALDNDDLRRGKPANHKKFGEDVAILVGDGLQTVSFELIGNAGLDSGVISAFAQAAGVAGMVGGQFMDIHSPGQKSKTYLQTMHSLKTGRLIEASVMLPFLQLQPRQTSLNKKRAGWAQKLGKLFQVVDDILDETAAASTLGKSAGKDRQSGKLTYTSVYGLQKARKIAEELCSELSTQADRLFEKSSLYKHIAVYVLNRQL